MEGWREQSRWLLRLEDFAGHSMGETFKSMLTALGRAARSKHQREMSSPHGGESRGPGATASTGVPREGEIMGRRGWSNRLGIGDPVVVGGKRKAMAETLSGGAPREGEIMGRRGWSNRLGIGDPVVVGGKRKAMAETLSGGAPREGEIMGRRGWSNRLGIGDPVGVGGKRKAMEETLSGGDVQCRRRPGKEVVEEGIGFAAGSGDEEWCLREEKSHGTRRKVGFTAKAGEGSGKKSKGSSPAPNDPPADMPQEFKDQIDGMGGKEVKLVIEKELSRTDLDRHICRVSIPKNQVRDLSFLRDEENRFVEAQNAMDVSVMGPKRSQALKFALVEMGSRNKAKPSLIYNFRSGWNNFASENELRVRDRIQIWSFRVDSDDCRDRLCFALVKLDDDDRRNSGGDVGHGDGIHDDDDDNNNNGGGPSSVPGGLSSEPASTSTPKKD